MISILLLAGFSIKGECPKVHISLLINCFGFNTDSDCLHCSTLLWIVINQVPVVECLIKLILQGAGMAQRWECSPPTNVSRGHMWVEFVVGSRPCPERFFSGHSGFPLSSKTHIPNSNSIWAGQALYREPLALVIAQALPLFDVEFEFTIYNLQSYFSVNFNCSLFTAKGGLTTEVWPNKFIDYKFLFP